MSFNLNVNLDRLRFGYDEVVKQTGFEGSMNEILRAALRTALSFANDIPTHVYMLTKISEKVGESEFLFHLNNKFVRPADLNKTGFKGHKFDVGADRMGQLRKFTKEHIDDELMPLFKSHNKTTPDFIHSWIDVSQKNPNINLTYDFGKDSANASLSEKLEEWRRTLSSAGAQASSAGSWIGII